MTSFKGGNLFVIEHDLFDRAALRLGQPVLGALIFCGNGVRCNGLGCCQIGWRQAQHLNGACLNSAELDLVLFEIGCQFLFARRCRRFDIGVTQHEEIDRTLITHIAIDQLGGSLGQGSVTKQAQNQLLATRSIALILEIFSFRQPALAQYLGKGVWIERAQRALEGRISPQHFAELILRNAQTERARHLIERRILRQILQHH